MIDYTNLKTNYEPKNYNQARQIRAADYVRNIIKKQVIQFEIDHNKQPNAVFISTDSKSDIECDPRLDHHLVDEEDFNLLYGMKMITAENMPTWSVCVAHISDISECWEYDEDDYEDDEDDDDDEDED